MLDRTKAEQQVARSISKVAKDSGVDPIDLDFNTWKKNATPDEYTSYTSLGVEFRVVKKANFKAKTVNTTKFDIRARAKQNDLSIARVEKETMFLDRFEEVASRVFKDKLVVGPYRAKPKAKVDRIANLILSDIHFGSDLDGRHTFIKYGTVEEARRLAKVTRDTCEYKRQYRDNTTLNVHLLGDIIQNSLHDPRDAADLAEQINRATWSLSQSLAALCNQFPHVNVFCVPGNHDRWPGVMKRDINHKDDSAANTIYFALNLIVGQKCKNVNFFVPEMPLYEVQLFDKRAMFTHGDTVFNFGFPGSTIDIKGARKQMNEWNGRRDVKDHISLFFIGHVHTGVYVRLPTGILMTNSSLIPSDEYAISSSIPYTANGAWLFESVPGRVVGDMRFLEVDETTDRDESLDSIIKPYEKKQWLTVP